MKKETYKKPELAVVSFKAEKGFAATGEGLNIFPSSGDESMQAGDQRSGAEGSWGWN